MPQFRKGIKGHAQVIVCETQKSTNNFADVVGAFIDVICCDCIGLIIKNVHASNSFNWKVLASIDGDTWIDAKTEATLTSGSHDMFEHCPSTWRFYKVQIKSTVIGNKGTALIHLIGK